MADRIRVEGLQADPALYAFIETEVLPGLGLSSRDFWFGLAKMLRDFGPRREALLERRATLQNKIDEWCAARKGERLDPTEQSAFFASIGYLEADEPHVEISPQGVDREFSKIAAPQLVAPLTDARALLGCVNARWSSLAKALYATDAISPLPPGYPDAPLDLERLARARSHAAEFLDLAAPLALGRHEETSRYWIDPTGALRAAFPDGSETGLIDPDKCVGWRGDPEAPEAVLLRNNRLHVEIGFDPHSPVGGEDPTGVADLLVEAAATAIVDLEDLVCVVDAEDKIKAWRNWLGFSRGDLEAPCLETGARRSLSLAPDRVYRAAGGAEVRLKGRALAMLRLVGLAPSTCAVLGPKGEEPPEFMLDLMIGALCAKHDLIRADGSGEGASGAGAAPRNSETGSIYVALTKLQGPEECRYVEELFSRVEECLRLPRHTLKAALMVEERRTLLNLKSCLQALRRRVVYMGLGPTDTAADEARLYAEAGPLLRSRAIKSESRLRSYERHLVDVAVESGFNGRAKVGRAAWARPQRMADMLLEKIVDADAGATSIDAFSPLAATLLARHYHQFDTRARQCSVGLLGRRTTLDALFRAPLLQPELVGAAEIREEMEDNCAILLNHAWRWIRLGLGFSRIRDLRDQEWLEDCSAVRLAAQHLHNWLRHGVVSEAALAETLRHVARLLDERHRQTCGYVAFGPRFDDPAFAAVQELIHQARRQPNGYADSILRRGRRAAKTAGPQNLLDRNLLAG